MLHSIMAMRLGGVAQVHDGRVVQHGAALLGHRLQAGGQQVESGGLAMEHDGVDRRAVPEITFATQAQAEVTLAQRYLDIEQLRFGERLRVRWDLDPACDAARVPPLLLQPLVENAVRYGVEPNEAGGELLVRTRLHGGEVELLVRNSVLASAPGGHGLALANVRERLRLLHDLAARLQIESEGERFAVRITLPKP